jgi:hypothetical protein
MEEKLVMDLPRHSFADPGPEHKLTISNSGSIGIGLTAPKHKVDIRCGCGAEDHLDNFQVSGKDLEFTCLQCRNIIRPG